MEFVIEAMNDTVRRTVKNQAIKAHSRHMIRMNASKLSREQLRALKRSIEDYCLKNVFSDTYKQYDKELASEVLWYHDT